MLKIVKQIIGKSGITNGEDLSKMAESIFGKRFIGVFVIKSNKDIPPLKNNQIAILNTNMHWYGIFKKNNKLYETDSYGIDRISNIKDDKPPKSFIQGYGGKDLMDCGQRLISNLIFDAGL